jgi:hypothetical protein
MTAAHPNRRPSFQQMRPKYRSAFSPASSLSPTNSTTRADGRRGSKSSDQRRGNASHSPNTKNLSYTKQTRCRLSNSPSPRRLTGHRRQRNQRNRRQEQIALEAALSSVARGKKEASQNFFFYYESHHTHSVYVDLCTCMNGLCFYLDCVTNKWLC